MILKILKWVGIVLASLLALVLLFLIIMNIAKYFIYSDYYAVREKIAPNPGLNKGYTPQGMTASDDGSTLYTAGYMVDGRQSRIYKIDMQTKKSEYYQLVSQGKPFYGHTGGIQYFKGDLYLANESDGIYKFSASSITGLSSGDSLEIGSVIHVNNHSSYIFSDGEYLYVGEFHDDEDYPCTNEITYNGETHRAIVTKYSPDNFDKPLEIYSIRDTIQGFARMPDGTMVLSRSYGVTDSHFYSYNQSAIVDTGIIKDGAKVFFLGKETGDLKAPAMMEDLDILDGKLIVFSESACDKYMYGKFFFAYGIYSFEL